AVAPGVWVTEVGIGCTAIPVQVFVPSVTAVSYVPPTRSTLGSASGIRGASGGPEDPSLPQAPSSMASTRMRIGPRYGSPGWQDLTCLHAELAAGAEEPEQRRDRHRDLEHGQRPRRVAAEAGAEDAVDGVAEAAEPARRAGPGGHGDPFEPGPAEIRRERA